MVIGGMATAASALSVQSCKEGWVLVPGDSSLGTSDFCVMQFEAQNPDWYTYWPQITDRGAGAEPRYDVPAAFTSAQPTSLYSTATNHRIPWVFVTQKEAVAACASIGAHLVTITEAQTINRNIEMQNTNWLHGVGQSCMYGGHIDGDPLSFVPAPMGGEQQSDPYQYMNEDSNDIARGIGQCPFVLSDYTSTPPALRNNGIYSRRTLYLSTGAILWDWSGNVGEWLADTCTNNGNGNGALATFPAHGFGNGWGYFDYNPQNHIGAAYTEWTQPYLFDYESIVLGPRNPALPGSAALNSDWGVGRYWGCYANGYAIYRGGYAFKGANGGVFNIDAGHTTNFNHNYVGFRCAMVPPAKKDTAPAISSIQPSQAAPGTPLIISGANFTPAGNQIWCMSGCTYSPGVIPNATDLPSSDGITIAYRVPIVGALPGTYAVAVKNENGTSNTAFFAITQAQTSSILPYLPFPSALTASTLSAIDSMLAPIGDILKRAFYK
ncbi:hypothetical protein C4568_04475 [Candidatus Parcubacteria bacterium]|nr:MAG: hypothetical protein C4568_04475 [Candidatus Parcubacteria bacterium]